MKENMRIGLIAVDKTNFPNIALGKIAAWHKAQGDSVEWAAPLFGEYDRVYASKIFTFTPDFMDCYDCEVVKGGTGYDLHKTLPLEIDRMQPDYSIYPQIDDKTAYGFLTRGCPNKCKWCVVPVKEGAVRPYMDIWMAISLTRILLLKAIRCMDQTLVVLCHGV